MLTVEILKKAGLELTDDQFNQIAKLSENDEKANLDKINLEKAALEKELAPLKAKVTSQEATITELNTDLKGLKTKLKETGDKKFQEQIDILEAGLADAKKAKEDLQTEMQAKLDAANNSFKEYKITSAMEGAMAGLSFKDGITETIQGILKREAIAEMHSLYDIEDVNGRLVFREKEGGKVVTDPKTFEPASAESLMRNNEALKEVLSEGKPKGGLGGSGKGPTGGKGGAFDASGYKTQVDADDALRAHLVSQNMDPTSGEFFDKFDELRSESGIQELPVM